jgi:hypothetical protein
MRISIPGSKARTPRLSVVGVVKLFGCFLFEELADFVEVEGIAVDDELVDSGVVGDGVDMLDGVAVFAEGVDDEIGVYVVHACQSTGTSSGGGVGSRVGEIGLLGSGGTRCCVWGYRGEY